MELFSIGCVFCTCILGSVIQNVTGFGFGIFVMTLFPFFMPTYLVAGTVSSCLGLTMSCVNAIRLRKDINFKLIPLPSIAYIIMVYIFITLSVSQSDTLLKRLFGMFLFFIAIYFVFIAKNLKIRPNLITGLTAGGISGIVSGLFGAGGGPPMVIYFMATTVSIKQYIATTQAFFAISGMFSAATRVANGLVTKEVLTYYAIGLSALLIGGVIGTKIQSKINDKMLKKLVYIYIAASGVIMTLTA